METGEVSRNVFKRIETVVATYNNPQEIVWILHDIPPENTELWEMWLKRYAAITQQNISVEYVCLTSEEAYIMWKITHAMKGVNEAIPQHFANEYNRLVREEVAACCKLQCAFDEWQHNRLLERKAVKPWMVRCVELSKLNPSETLMCGFLEDAVASYFCVSQIEASQAKSLLMQEVLRLLNEKLMTIAPDRVRECYSIVSGILEATAAIDQWHNNWFLSRTLRREV